MNEVSEASPATNGSDLERQVMLASFVLYDGLQIKVPKKRGSGYLKCPLGHHHRPWVHEIEYDVDGLDGYLHVYCGYMSADEENRKLVLEKVMPVLVSAFGMEWKLVSASEWWNAT